MIYILHTLLGPQGRDESICQDPVHLTPTWRQALLTQPLRFLSDSSVPLRLSCRCFWITANLFHPSLKYRGHHWNTTQTVPWPFTYMGPWRQGQARTQHYWPLGLGTFHCPHGLEGKSLDVLGRYSPPRGLGQTLPASALQGPKYGLYCWIFANKLLLEK